VLYGLALEVATGELVKSGRLWFCTSAGGFKEIDVPISETTRRAGLEVLEVIDRAIEHGTLAAAPRSGACEWCEFRTVCGPHEEYRTGRKAAGRFADLEALRSRP
jgi:CRISPR/Cas system-associated exonuclease Cas4 (RecB family)